MSLKQQRILNGRSMFDDEQFRKGFDSKTLFYDIFFRSSWLICIGPPFYSIGNPLAIKHRGKNLRYKAICGYHIAMAALIYIKIDKREFPTEIEFIFKKFTLKVFCTCQDNIHLDHSTISLLSLQKDNSLIWIKDWCRWHIRVHGVGRIFLYDNASSYWANLSERLAELEETVEIILVPWHYKYGPVIPGAEIYRFCRSGVLNHFRLLFGHQNAWCINLDIDEFLYSNSHLPLEQYLALPKNLASTAIGLPCYLFPRGQQLDKNPPRFYHSQFRYRPSYYNPLKAPKYICQPQLVKIMDNHRVYLQTWKLFMVAILFQKTSFFSLVNKIYRRFNWVYSKLLLLLLLLKTPNFFSRTKKQQLLPQDSLKMDNPSSLFFFFHFRDLYTDWRKGKLYAKQIKNQHINLTAPENLVKDRRAIDKAIEVGMITESEVMANNKSLP